MASTAVVHDIAALLLTDLDELTVRFTEILREVFTRFDSDHSGGLNDAQLNHFARTCNATSTNATAAAVDVMPLPLPLPDETDPEEELAVGFTESDLAQIHSFFELNPAGELTFVGFCDMYQTQTSAEPEETWSDLNALGYNLDSFEVKRDESSPKKQTATACTTSVTVRGTCHADLPMTIEGCSTLADLQGRIAAATGVIADRQRLLHAGRVVAATAAATEDEGVVVSLASLRIDDGADLLLSARPASGEALSTPRHDGPPRSCTVRVSDTLSIDVEQSNEAGIIGGTVWSSACALARYLHQSEEGPLLRGKRVIELGAGTGLCGLAASYLQPRSVTLTDQASHVDLLRRNAAANAGGCVDVSAAELTWGDAEAMRPQLARLSPPFDYVIGSDLAYTDELFAPLVRAIRAVSSEDTVVLYAHEWRTASRELAFFDALAKAGFKVTQIPNSTLAGGVLPGGGKDNALFRAVLDPDAAAEAFLDV